MKEIHELQRGDKLQLEDGSKVTVQSVEKGFYTNSKLITYTNGLWSCYCNKDKVQLLTN